MTSPRSLQQLNSGPVACFAMCLDILHTPEVVLCCPMQTQKTRPSPAGAKGPVERRPCTCVWRHRIPIRTVNYDNNVKILVCAAGLQKARVTPSVRAATRCSVGLAICSLRLPTAQHDIEVNATSRLRSYGRAAAVSAGKISKQTRWTKLLQT